MGRLTVVASTVAELGTPTEDGTLGIIRVGTGDDVWEERLRWNADEEAWIGQPRYTMRFNNPDGFLASGGASTWGYPFNTSGTEGIDNGYGFSIHAIPFASALLDAGLRIQENLDAVILNGDATQTHIALNWYGLDDGDDFLAPTPDNFGVEIIGDAESTTYKKRFCTGWQDSPMTPPDNDNFYPEIYTKGVSFKLYELTARYRWVYTEAAASPGDHEDSDNRYSISDRHYHWHIADNIPKANGVQIAEWPDYSGIGRHLVQATGSKQPILVRDELNGHSVVRFDGVDDYLGYPSSSTNINQPFSGLFVMKQYTGGSFPQVWFSGFSAAPLFYANDNNGDLHLWGGASELNGDIGSWGDFAVYAFRANGGSSEIYRNGVSIVSGSAGSDGPSGVKIGVRGSDNGLASHIDIAEILMFYRSLSDAEILAISTEMMTKYGLS